MALTCIAFSSAIGCADLSEKTTPTAECVSGERWIAGDLGHEEMHPGGDCMGCHTRKDGPLLALGGTVYAVNAPNQEKDCYGVEGVTVTVTDANNTVRTFETNKAGNFFLEGDPSIVAKPFHVEVQAWTAAGAATTIPMGTAPETGACAQCHGADMPPATGINPTRAFPFTTINIGHTTQDYGL